ncbi:MAG: PEP-utilizing enzyme [Candidatus Aenigmatarchaeota archaeon]
MRRYEFELVVEGIIACSGYGRGHAIILDDIDNIDDKRLNNLPSRYALVSKYTTPDLAPQMYGSLGIITDIGSTTTHAPNIAREFDIPCIVGTGNATKCIRKLEEIVPNARGNLQDNFGKQIPAEEIIKRAKKSGGQDADDILKKMLSEGICFSPRPGVIEKIG